MHTAVFETPTQPGPPLFTRKAWTRAECEVLASLEPFQSQSPVVAMLQALLAPTFGFWFLLPESLIDVSPGDNPTSEPQPDLIVVAREASAYILRRPGPADIRLLVEVADSSLAFDLTIKARLCARARIAEYWVADPRARQIHVHRNPAAGIYESVITHHAGDSLAPLAAPHSPLLVGAALPDLSA